MIIYNELVPYLTVLCGILELSFALTEKCSAQLTALRYDDRRYYGQRDDECKIHNYKCHDLSEVEFYKFIGSLSMTCHQTCRHYNNYHGYQESFRVCDLIHELSLNSSSMHYFSQKFLQEFGNLTKLHLENISVAEIERAVFYNLTNLEYLDISKSQIERIDYLAFEDLPKLTKLRLNNNYLANFTMINVSSLVILEIKSNKLQSLRLQDLENLNTLDLRNNSLKNLTDCFKNLRAVRYFYLQHNYIEHLRINNFGEEHGVKYLDLSDNKIRSIEVGTFHNMTNLQCLMLDNNLLTKLPENLFSNNLNLDIISLRDNKLNSLGNNLFRGLQAVSQLDLKGNALTEIKGETFGIHSGQDQDNPPIITVVSLADNKLSQINLSIFYHMLTNNLDISNNNLRALDIARLSCNLNASFNAIERLYETHGKIEKKELITRVIEINLGYNQIRNLKPGLFTRFPNLLSLMLEHNQIAKLPYGIFDGLRRLTYLNLGYNSLNVSPPAIFPDLPSLKTLIISNNHFKTLEMKKILDALPNLKTFDIDFNLFECDYLHEMLSSCFVNGNRNLTLKTEMNTNHNVYSHSSWGVRCIDPDDLSHTNNEYNGNSYNPFLIQNGASSASTDTEIPSIVPSATSTTFGLTETTKAVITTESVTQSTDKGKFSTGHSEIGVYAQDDRLEELIKQINELHTKLSDIRKEANKYTSASDLKSGNTFSHFEHDFRGQNAGIVIIIILTLVIILISVYNVYENRHWKDEMRKYRTSINTMVEDI